MNNQSAPVNCIKIKTNSPEETKAVGEALGRSLRGGEVVALIGPLGCGKTCFVQGMVVGLDLKEGQRVKSPSYVIINEYRGRVAIHHIDLYRLNNLTELEELGLEELIAGEGVTVIEWAEKGMEFIPPNHIQVNFQILSPTERFLQLTGIDFSFEN